MASTLDDLLQRFEAGSEAAAARLISIVEDGRPDALEALDRLHPRVGRAYRVGVTGPPGAGKSTLVDRLSELLLAAGEKPGVVAVDPTSPFTGGALLGDRVRMGPAASNGGVFFRSLASRGSLGGLALHASEVADVLDAFGCTWVLLETVGVGQSELDVAEKAHTTVVVLVPESGDGIQAMKAGLMEIADVFVINKADRAGAEKLEEEIRGALELRHGSGWCPPVLLAEARSGRGVEEVLVALRSHRKYLQEGGRLQEKRRRALESRVRDLVHEELEREVWADPELHRMLAAGIQEIERGEMSPQRLALGLLARARSGRAHGAAAEPPGTAGTGR